MSYKDSIKMTNSSDGGDPGNRRDAQNSFDGNSQTPADGVDTESLPVVPVGAPHIDQSKYLRTPMHDVTYKLEVPDAPTSTLHEPAHFRENTEGFMPQIPDARRTDKSSIPLWAKVTAGGAVIAAAVGVGYGLNSRHEGPRQETVAAGEAGPGQAQTLETDYSKIDIATYPHEAFVQLPYGVQIDKAARYFDQAFKEGAVDKYLADAAAVNGYHMQGGVGTGSINDLPQEIANRQTVEINTFSHEPNLNLARNLVSGVFKPGTSSYNRMVQWIGDGSPRTPTTTTTYEGTGVYLQGKFAGMAANGTPTRIYVAAADSSGSARDEVVQEMRSALDPSVTKVVVVYQVGAKESPSVYRENLNGWIPPS